MKAGILLIIGVLCFNAYTNAQVGINSNGNNADNSAMLDVNSDQHGFLLPRLTTTQRDLIANPAQSLMIYNTTEQCLQIFENSEWNNMWCSQCSAEVATQPTAQSACENGDAIFTTAVSGTSISYLWQESPDGGSSWNDLTDGGDGPTVAGASTSQLSLSGIPASYDTYQYRCKAFGSCSTTDLYTNEVSLGISSVISITDQPTDVASSVSQSATFSVSAMGGGLTYQWQESTDGGSSWSDITDGGSNPVYSGSTNASLELNNLPLTHNGNQYKCIISGSCSSDETSSVANLTVTTCAVSVTDYDGNVYSVVGIGSQCWMGENLKVTHYPDGTEITLVTDNTIWKNQSETDASYCYFNNTSANGYGAMYTWAAAMNGATTSNAVPSGVQGICPDGFHLPSRDEWDQMISFLNPDAGAKLKESGTTNWDAGNTGTNTSGFTALGTGYRNDSDGTFKFEGDYAKFWSSFGTSTSQARRVSMQNTSNIAGLNSVSKNYGFSVRCVQD